MSGGVLWIRICPSFCLEVFLGLAYSFFSETQHGVRGSCGVVHCRARFLEKKIAAKIEEMGKKEMVQKFDFLNLLENFVVIFFLNLVYSKSLCYLLYSCTIPLFGKSMASIIPYTVVQSDLRIFKSTLSLEQNDEKAWIFACWYRFMEIKSWSKSIGVGMVKNGCDHSGIKTLKLDASQKAINWTSWFLDCWFVATNSGKLKVF